MRIGVAFVLLLFLSLAQGIRDSELKSKYTLFHNIMLWLKLKFDVLKSFNLYFHILKLFFNIEKEYFLDIFLFIILIYFISWETK